MVWTQVRPLTSLAAVKDLPDYAYRSGAGFQQGPHLRTEKIPTQYE